MGRAQLLYTSYLHSASLSNCYTIAKETYCAYVSTFRTVCRAIIIFCGNTHLSRVVMLQ